MKSKQIVIEFPDDISEFAPGIESIISRLMADNKVNEYLITAAIVSDVEMADINRRFRSTLGTTDVLSFQISEEPLEGEIYISAEQVRSGSISDGIPFKEELFKLAIHGTLHILGFHHDTEEEKSVNEELMKDYLRNCL